MEDKEIITLYFDRNEAAIDETKHKYGHYCFSIAYRILSNQEDSEECVNDTYIAVWNSIPPERPQKLSLYLAAIVRNISLKKSRYDRAQKRNRTRDVLLSELQECIPDSSTPEREMETKALSKLLDSFIRTLEHEERCFFIKRYWYMYSVSDIAKEYSCGESKVKMKLKRTRDRLYELLKKEEIDL